jgi:hypothetical protein
MGRLPAQSRERPETKAEAEVRRLSDALEILFEPRSDILFCEARITYDSAHGAKIRREFKVAREKFRQELSKGVKRDLNVVSKTGAYTITEDDDIILADATGGAFSVTLPAVSGEARDSTSTVKRMNGGANAVTIATPGAETVDGAANHVLSDQYDCVTLSTDGSNWMVARSNISEKSTTVSTLTDSTIDAPADNEVLAYDSGTSKWINQTAAEAGLSATGHTHSHTHTTLAELMVGSGSASAMLEVESASDVGKEIVVLDQNDSDQPFIDYQGTSAANSLNTISTWSSGNSIQGFIRIEINGVTYWMPYYDDPTS